MAQAVSGDGGSSSFLSPVVATVLAAIPNLPKIVAAHPKLPVLIQSHPNTSAAMAIITATMPHIAPAPAPNTTTAAPVNRQPGIQEDPGATTFTPTQSLGGYWPTVSTPANGTSTPLTPSPGFTTPQGFTITPPPTPGVPNPALKVSPNQPLPQPGGGNVSPPIGNTGVPPQHVTPQVGQIWQNPTPVSQAQATQMSGVVPGPMAMNHVPYGPELTGLSQFGGLITPNGTPVAMSNWQKMQLDPTSIARYNSYVSDIAGMNPADLAQIGQNETGGQLTDFKAPTNFLGTGLTPAPAGG